jgi:hypothetical protein
VHDREDPGAPEIVLLHRAWVVEQPLDLGVAGGEGLRLGGMEERVQVAVQQ